MIFSISFLLDSDEKIKIKVKVPGIFDHLSILPPQGDSILSLRKFILGVHGPPRL
jgi:hypothetical protein